MHLRWSISHIFVCREDNILKWHIRIILSLFHHSVLVSVTLCFCLHHNLKEHFLSFQGDVTTVIEDYSAGNNSELTVTKGQQVELLDTAPPGEQNWCLVRMINAEDGEPTQGLVPISSLKPIPALQNLSNRNSMDLEGNVTLTYNIEIEKNI